MRLIYLQHYKFASANTLSISPFGVTLLFFNSKMKLYHKEQFGPDVFPFTGRKDSAEGTLSVPDAIRAFSIRSLVAFKMNAANNQLINEIVHEDTSNFLSTKFIF